MRIGTRKSTMALAQTQEIARRLAAETHKALHLGCALGDVTAAHDDLYAGALPTLTAQQIGEGVSLLDARAPERFRGDVEPIDPVAGHIPGAKNLPSASVLADDGTFLAEDALARLVPDVDGRLGAYCGSGVTASITVAAMRCACTNNGGSRSATSSAAVRSRRCARRTCAPGR